MGGSARHTAIGSPDTPSSGALRVAVGASLATQSVPVKLPEAGGENETVIGAESPAGITIGASGDWESQNPSPVTVTLDTVSGAVPTFRMFTDSSPTVPRATEPNRTRDGSRLMAGPRVPPRSCTRASGVIGSSEETATQAASAG